MGTNLAEESGWAAGVAARLRLVQVTSADAPRGQKHEFLRETIEEALKEVPSTRRDAFLTALAERFPAWNQPASPAPSPSPAGPETPEEMVMSLAALVPGLSPEEKAALAGRMAEAGLLPSPAADVGGGKELQSLETKLGLSQPPRIERVVALLAQLIEMLEKLDQVACKTFENLPARPSFSNLHAGDFQEALRQFLAAEEGPGLEQALQSGKKMIEQHRRAMVALMACQVGLRNVRGAGFEFARGFLDLFSPQNIRDVVQGTIKTSVISRISGMFGGLEEKCWKRYSEMFREDLKTPEHIEMKVKDAVASTAERIYQLNQLKG